MTAVNTIRIVNPVGQRAIERAEVLARILNRLRVRRRLRCDAFLARDLAMQRGLLLDQRSHRRKIKGRFENEQRQSQHCRPARIAGHAAGAPGQGREDFSSHAAVTVKRIGCCGSWSLSFWLSR